MSRQRTPGWIVLPLICFAAHAQYLQQGNKLVAPNGSGSSQGTSVAVSADGNTVVFGGISDGSGAGAVWVYTRNNGVLTPQAKLLGSGAIGIAGQGRSVALSADGNTLAVGGPVDNDGTGAVWIFVRANGIWTQQAKRWGTVLTGLSNQGISVALSADGNTVLLGGDLYNSSVGAAWVFTRDNTGTWGVLFDTLTGGSNVGTSHQGTSVALSADGNTAIIGGPGDNGGAGAAWVFTRVIQGAPWNQQGIKLTGAGATAPAAFGSAVALSADGNTAMVGGYRDNNNTGAVWAFTRAANGQWSPQSSKLTGSDAVPSRYLGASVSLSADGNTALVGGPGSLAGVFGRSPAIGATWVFTRTGGIWVQQGTELIGTGTAGNDALQGTSVAVTSDGATAYIGGPADNGGTGAVWVFARPLAQFPPTIATQPASQTVSTGQSVTLSVIVAGTGPFSFQWYQGAKGNTSTPVGTNSGLFTTPPLTSTATYWVRVTNASGSADSETATLTVPTTSPSITIVSNAAGGGSTISPNSWVAILGTNLAPAGDVRTWQTTDFTNNQMPVQLDNVSVTVNGRRAYVSYISPTQVNILTPPDSFQGTVPVQVTNGTVSSGNYIVQLQPVSPSFFVFGAGPYAAAEHADGSYLGPASLFPGSTTPARPGETIVLYGNGFGATAAPITPGSPVQSSNLPTAPLITIGGIAAVVQFAGLVAPGEFQFNVVVPTTVPDGDNILTATYAGLSTQSRVLLTVQR